ncbi:uncharacterized protein LOC133844625 [Drosophila sulfurigaster albostrigata]|uniref:uncharacterized protein LOC133844625 n=1 Tax=Drosophila sulfurigaster albostrigata TaxID=89887 RepID=UPI002D21EB06|nr:uncharacterized protein LOC133844625 [Drosophila sulfurigaster albostrigata]
MPTEPTETNQPEEKMTKEDVNSSKRENVAASAVVSNDSDILPQRNEASVNVLSNSARNDTSNSASNSPPHQLDEIQNNGDAVDAADAVDGVDADENELLRRMRADAVDNTMYSKKFILQTMMTLSQLPPQTPLETELEDELCKLWDMSVSKEVVDFLLLNDSIDVIITAIEASEDVRLYEILVGLLGNMCAQVECVEQLTSNPEWVELLLRLCTCMDTCMLLQLMRVYQYVMAHVVTGKEQLGIDWYICFAACDSSAKNLGFILQQCISEELLVAALKAINAVLASCAMVEEENSQTDLNLKPFAEVFLVQELVDGVNNAFMRLMRDDLAKQAEELGDAAASAANVATTDEEDDEDESGVPKITCDIEIIQTYLNICTILVQLPEAQLSMASHTPNIMCCLTRILIFLQQPTQLHPLGERQEEYLEDMAHICSCLKYCYDKEMFENLLSVWLILRQHIEDYAEYDENDFEAFDDESRSQYEDNAFKLLRLLAHMLITVDHDVMVNDIAHLDAMKTELLRCALQEDVLLQRAHQRLNLIINDAAGQAK